MTSAIDPKSYLWWLNPVECTSTNLQIPSAKN